MRLKLIVSAIAAVATCAVFSIANHNSKQQLTGAELANIEALSQIELPGVTITCNYGSNGGKCWESTFVWKMCEEYMFYQCNFSGFQTDYCTMPTCK